MQIVAVDNSESLLHTADSIAALSDNNRPDIMFLPVVFTSYKMIQPMALEQPDTVASLTKHEMPTIEIDNEWIETSLGETASRTSICNVSPWNRMARPLQPEYAARASETI